MTGQRFYPDFTMPKSGSEKSKPDSRDPEWVTGSSAYGYALNREPDSIPAAVAETNGQAGGVGIVRHGFVF